MKMHSAVDYSHCLALNNENLLFSVIAYIIIFLHCLDGSFLMDAGCFSTDTITYFMLEYTVDFVEISHAFCIVLAPNTLCAKHHFFFVLD